MDICSTRRRQTCGGRQQGFTLIESLVALVVLSIGLLGVAKLVLGAVHADDSAYMRGQATQLAYELLDQMRANRPGALSNNYTGGPGVNNNCSGVACTPLQLAQLDEFNFSNRAQQALPNGTYAVGIANDAFADTIATISVTWDDSIAASQFGNVGAVQTVTLESIL